MATEENTTLAPAAITWPFSSNEMQCSNTMSSCASKSIPSYLECTSNQKHEGISSPYRRNVGGGAENGEHGSYSGAVVTPSSSLSSPISCPPPPRLSDFEHSYYFNEQYCSLSTQSMYERITEARNNHDTIWHVEEWVRAQVRKGSFICHHINDQNMSTSSGELKDKRREDEMFELEL